MSRVYVIAEGIASLGHLGAMGAGNAWVEVGQVSALNVTRHVALEAANLATVPALPHGPPVRRVRCPRHSLRNRVVQA